MKKILFLVCFLCLCGCRTHMTDITMISTKNIDLNKTNIDAAPTKKNVTGKDSVFIFLFIPTGIPTLQGAVNDALKNGNGDLLTNASVYSSGWWFLVGQNSIEITGDVVNTKGAK